MWGSQLLSHGHRHFAMICDEDPLMIKDELDVGERNPVAEGQRGRMDGMYMRIASNKFPINFFYVD
jgi:hypothetical protein